MTNRYMNKHYSEISRGYQDYGFKDKQGREVGYGWSFHTVTIELLPESATGGYIYRGGPLSYIAVDAYPTRNGKHYGASGRDVQVQTIDEATACVARRMAQALKRDTKKFCP